MPRIRPTSRERSSAATTAWPDLAGRARDRDREALGCELAREAMRPFYRIPPAAVRAARFRRMSGAELGLARVGVPRLRRRGRRGADDRAGGRHDAQLAARRWPASARPLLALACVVAVLGGALAALPIDDLRLVDRRCCCSLFGAAVAAQGGAARGRAEGAARRAQRLTSTSSRRRGRRAARAGGWDAYSFAVAAKGVLLEGLEVALIVVTFGANQHQHRARRGRGGARRGRRGHRRRLRRRAPLAQVPENTMKFAVGVMLSSFGIFWAAEGARACSWPGGDAILLAIVPPCSLRSPLASRRCTAAG